MTPESSTNRAARPLGLWGFAPLLLCALMAAHRAEEGPLRFPKWWLGIVEWSD
jgi:hypothetical protein